MIEKNMEPLSSENEAFLMKVLKYLAVELGTIASEEDILSTIESSKFNCIPRGILAAMILHGYAKTEEGGDKIRLIIKEKEVKHICVYTDEPPLGPCMEYCKLEVEEEFPHTIPKNPPKTHSYGVTSGEKKISKLILEKCDFETVPSVSKKAFKRYLDVILPDINKKVKTNLAFKVMLRGGFILEEDGNITLGKNGKELLSQ